MSSISDSTNSPKETWDYNQLSLSEIRNYQSSLSKIETVNSEKISKAIDQTLKILTVTKDTIGNKDEDIQGLEPDTLRLIRYHYGYLGLSEKNIEHLHLRNLIKRVVYTAIVTPPTTVVIGTLTLLGISTLVASVALPILLFSHPFFAFSTALISFMLAVCFCFLLIGVGIISINAGAAAYTLLDRLFSSPLAQTALKELGNRSEELVAIKELLEKNGKLTQEELVRALSLIPDKEYKELISDLNLIDFQEMKISHPNLFRKTNEETGKTEDNKTKKIQIIQTINEKIKNNEDLSKLISFLCEDKSFFIALVKELSPKNFCLLSNFLKFIYESNEWKISESKQDFAKFCSFVRNEYSLKPDHFLFSFSLNGKTINYRLDKNDAPEFFLKQEGSRCDLNAINRSKIQISEKDLHLFMRLMKAQDPHGISIPLIQVESLWALASATSSGKIKDLLLIQYQQILKKKTFVELCQVPEDVFKNCTEEKRLTEEFQCYFEKLVEQQPLSKLMNDLLTVIESKDWSYSGIQEKLVQVMRDKMESLSVEELFSCSSIYQKFKNLHVKICYNKLETLTRELQHLINEEDSLSEALYKKEKYNLNLKNEEIEKLENFANSIQEKKTAIESEQQKERFLKNLIKTIHTAQLEKFTKTEVKLLKEIYTKFSSSTETITLLHDLIDKLSINQCRSLLEEFPLGEAPIGIYSIYQEKIQNYREKVEKISFLEKETASTVPHITLIDLLNAQNSGSRAFHKLMKLPYSELGSKNFWRKWDLIVSINDRIDKFDNPEVRDLLKENKEFFIAFVSQLSQVNYDKIKNILESIYEKSDWEKESNSFSGLADFIRPKGDLKKQKLFEFKFCISSKTQQFNLDEQDIDENDLPGSFKTYSLDENSVCPFFTRHLELNDKRNILYLAELLDPNAKVTFNDVDLLMDMVQNWKMYSKSPEKLCIPHKKVELLWQMADALSLSDVKDLLFPHYFPLYKKMLKQKSLVECMEMDCLPIENCSFTETFKQEFKEHFYTKLKIIPLDELLSFEDGELDSFPGMVRDLVLDHIEIRLNEKYPLIYHLLTVALSISETKENIKNSQKILQVISKLIETRIPSKTCLNLAHLYYSENYKKIKDIGEEETQKIAEMIARGFKEKLKTVSIRELGDLFCEIPKEREELHEVVRNLTLQQLIDFENQFTKIGLELQKRIDSAVDIALEKASMDDLLLIFSKNYTNNEKKKLLNQIIDKLSLENLLLLQTKTPNPYPILLKGELLLQKLIKLLPYLEKVQEPILKIEDKDFNSFSREVRVSIINSMRNTLNAKTCEELIQLAFTITETENGTEKYHEVLKQIFLIFETKVEALDLLTLSTISSFENIKKMAKFEDPFIEKIVETVTETLDEKVKTASLKELVDSSLSITSLIIAKNINTKVEKC